MCGFGSALRRYDHDSAIEQRMEHCVDSPRMVEQEEVQRTKRRTRNSIPLEEVVEVMENRLRTTSGSGREKDDPRMVAVTDFLDEGMIFPSGGQPFETIFANHPLRPTALEEVIMIGTGALGERHEHRAAVEELEHHCDRRSVEVADERDDVAPLYRAQIYPVP